MLKRSGKNKQVEIDKMASLEIEKPKAFTIFPKAHTG
jgi:hypothetical protein